MSIPSARKVPSYLTAKQASVVHICYGGEGGQLAAVRILVHEFKARGLPTDVVALGFAESLKGQANEWSHPRSLNLVKIKRQGDFGSMLSVISAIRRIKPRVIFCHSHRHALAGVVGQILAGRLPTLVVVEHQSTHLRSKKDNFLSGAAIAVSRGVVLLSRQYQETYPLRRFQKALRRPTFIIPNGVLVRRKFRVVEREPLSQFSHPKRVGMASRLVPSKQHDVLLRALKALRTSETCSDVRLIIAGEGPTAKALESLVEDLEVSDIVDFLGHVPTDEMQTFFENLDVYAHGTLGEGLSIALLEAAAAGTPIVVSDVPGVRDFFVHDRTALLVPPSDPAAMAESIARALHADEGARLATNAHDWVTANYSGAQMATGYLAALDAVDPKGKWEQS